MLLRAIGTAAISLGMVTIPVKIFVVTTKKTPPSRQMAIPCGARIRSQRRCPIRKVKASPEEINAKQSTASPWFTCLGEAAGPPLGRARYEREKEARART